MAFFFNIFEPKQRELSFEPLKQWSTKELDIYQQTLITELTNEKLRNSFPLGPYDIDDILSRDVFDMLLTSVDSNKTDKVNPQKVAKAIASLCLIFESLYGMYTIARVEPDTIPFLEKGLTDSLAHFSHRTFNLQPCIDTLYAKREALIERMNREKKQNNRLLNLYAKTILLWEKAQNNVTKKIA
jgi:hypothetical protein